ncbi:spore coat protein GerQ [Bacillus suaedae]|uniref:Spore coat protein GerQ n=1 Tax=Halalkalibacter suaedae TaxID=2822140 RepID=A0A940WXX4_9BACI|nr:spore coat protein GerQ [Bacillus suaedae]MBP3952742.1 spore coat protein GerQ [Bacillus suaedae]
MNQQQWYPQYGQTQAGQAQPQAQTQAPTSQTQGSVPYYSSQAYQTPGFVQAQQYPPLGGPVPGYQQPQLGGQDMLPLEQSYIENILRLNRGKVASFYMTFENNSEWNAKIFRGVVEEAGRDHIVVGDLQDQTHYLLLMVNLDYVEFDEPIDYDYSYGGSTPFQLTQYPPRQGQE